VRAGDLNPVAVLINRTLVEIPARFAGRPPVHPDAQGFGTWSGAQGLAEDVRRYGAWMREAARRRIGHLYPDATLDDGRRAPVIAWLWARTVTCPNPACGATMPLVSTFKLATKKGKER
jgi:putative DNA methylase